MSEESTQEHPGGSSTQAGGEGQKSDFVSLASHQKLLDERKSDKRRLDAALAELNEFKEAQKLQEEQKLIEEKNFSELLSQHKTKIGELEGEINKHVTEKQDFRKMNAALSLLQQKGVNLESKYLGLIPIDQISLSETGDIDATSVAEVVESFQQEHPRLTVPQARLLPNLKSGDSSTTMSVDEWKSLAKRDPKKAEQALKDKKVKFDFGS